MENEPKTPYPFSYHIFAWPFQIHKKPGNDMGTPERYVEELLAKFPSGGWREMKSGEIAATGADEQEELMNRFMLWQYLSVAGRDIYRGVNPLPDSVRERRDICRILRLGTEQRGGIGKYTIAYKKKNSEGEITEQKSYELRVEKVELHIYAFGCGILFLYTENWEYEGIRDIQRIADYGRRIALPFLPREEDGNILTADVLKLDIPETNRLFSRLDFRILEKQYRAKAPEPRTGFLHDLVEAASVDIVPFTDDRMFEVELFEVELIRNGALSTQIAQEWKDPERNAELKKTLYSLIYVDDGDPTCQDGFMRNRLLEEAIDPRWADYGTIHAATEFSLLCVTSDYPGIYESVIRPFIVEYPYLVSLALAQRTGIAGHSEAAGHLAGEKNSLFKWRGRLIQLQKDFNVFRNQIMIPEMTNQDQGMEIYELLRRQTRVQEQEELLDDQLEDLFDVADANFQTALTWIALFFAVLSPFVEGFVAPLMDKWGTAVFQFLGLLP